MKFKLSVHYAASQISYAKVLKVLQPDLVVFIHIEGSEEPIDVLLLGLHSCIEDLVGVEQHWKRLIDIQITLTVFSDPDLSLS